MCLVNMVVLESSHEGTDRFVLDIAGIGTTLLKTHKSEILNLHSCRDATGIILALERDQALKETMFENTNLPSSKTTFSLS